MLRRTSDKEYLLYGKCFFLLIVWVVSGRGALMAQADYTFNGGNWSDTANWNPSKPDTLLSGEILGIVGSGIIDEDFTINPGASVSIGFTSFSSVTLTLSSGTLTNNGTLTVGDNFFGGPFHYFEIDSGQTFINNGSLNVSGSLTNAGVLDLNSGSTLTNNNILVNSSTGELRIDSTATLNTKDNFSNAGTLRIDGTMDYTGGTFAQSATTAVLAGGGSLETNGINLTLNGGEVQGNLSLELGAGELTLNGASMTPGNSAGTLTVNGDLSYSGSSALNIELFDAQVSDRVEVSGTCTIGTSATLTLDQQAINLDDGATWNYLEAGTLSGTWGSYTVRNKPSGVQDSDFQLAYINTSTPDTAAATYRGSSLFLPVEWLDFTAVDVEGKVRLRWRTAWERNNAFIAVERSGDGTHFQEIGRITGAGTTQIEQAYQFLDISPVPGINYYRLRQEDFDGSTKYSSVIAIDIQREVEQLGMRLFPNPAKDVLRIEWDRPLRSFGGVLRIYSISVGQWVISFEAPGGQDAVELPLQQLQPGKYLLQFIYDNNVVSQPFVKQ